MDSRVSVLNMWCGRDLGVFLELPKKRPMPLAISVLPRCMHAEHMRLRLEECCAVLTICLQSVASTG